MLRESKRLLELLGWERGTRWGWPVVGGGIRSGIVVGLKCSWIEIMAYNV